MSQARPYILAETNWKEVKERVYQAAVLPWGATEAHNYHLPYATDNYQVEYIIEQSAQKAWEGNALPIVLPTIPFGVNTGQLDIKLCMNINPSTQLAILKDIADVLVRHAIYKLVILNGHGGNDFKTMIRELSIHFPALKVVWINWYQVADWSAYFTDLGDHAGEMETSVMMHIKPEYVRPLDEAGDGRAKVYRIAGLKQGWAQSQREWSQVTADTGVGNPALATAEKGQKYLAACIDGLADFLIEFCHTPLDRFYE